MRILALDTSTGPASVALYDDGTIVAEHADGEATRQSQRLVSATDALIRAHGGYDGLDAIAVTNGPGGFTGIRVALAAAHGLALACDVPLLGITTLETFAWHALHNKPQNFQAIPLVNAFRNQVYTQVFSRNELGMSPLCEEQAVDIQEAANFAAQYPNALRLGNTDAAQISVDDYVQHPAPLARYTAEYAAVLLADDKAHAIASHPAIARYIRPPDAKQQTPFLRQ